MTSPTDDSMTRCEVHRGKAMASALHIAVMPVADTSAQPGLAVAAARRVADLEHRWSRFLPLSDIDRLNRARGSWVDVAPSTLVLLGVMRDGPSLSEGRFDPTMLPSLVLAGYRDRRTGRPDTSFVSTPVRSMVAKPADAITVDPARGRARLAPGVAVDPGAVGKGLAADLVVADLLAGRLGDGAAGALVGIGGDLAFGGAAPEGGWSIAIEPPERSVGAAPQQPLETFSITGNGGIATSSTRSHRWRGPNADGTVEHRHHILDPATESPATTDLASVTVVAGTGWLAEVAATSLLLVGRDGLHAEAARLGSRPEFGGVTPRFLALDLVGGRIDALTSRNTSEVAA